jgi:predicted DNA-binding protein
MSINLKEKTGKNDQITTARLPMDTRYRLDALARAKNKTKSQIIIEALEFYYNQEENEIDSYTLGLPYFGKYSSGESDLSTTYKERLREKIRAKYHLD